MRPVRRTVVVVLALLVLVLGVLLGRVLWLQDSDSDQVAEQLSSEARVGSMIVAGEGEKSAGLSAAASATEKVLSYSWKSLEADMRTARTQLAPEQRKKYDDTMGEIRDRTEQNQVVVKATVASASVLTATAHDVKTLLFVNQETTGKHLQAPRLDQNRVLVTLHRDSGEWTITEMTAL